MTALLKGSRESGVGNGVGKAWGFRPHLKPATRIVGACTQGMGDWR
jgi:hypothetical protein